MPNKFHLPKLAAVAIPAAAVLVTVIALAVTIHHRNNTIESLRTMLKVQGTESASDGSSGEKEPYFEPINVDHHYDLAGHKILLKDDTFGQIWIPVLKDVPLSTHPLEQLKEQENGRMASFATDGRLNAMTGIDLSSHNTVTDWNAVKADGIDFVMLRVGYRTYGGGELRKDEKFRSFYDGAKAAGLKVGAYFFSQAITEQEAVEEAILTAKQLNGLALDFPVAYDWEIIYDDTARTDNVPVETLTSCTLAFCENITSFGYDAVIYQNKRTSLLKLDLPRLQDYPLWLAEYGNGPTYIYDYGMWQYSCTGTVKGITGAVDLNLSFYDYSLPDRPAVSLDPPAGSKTPAETAAAP